MKKLFFFAACLLALLGGPVMPAVAGDPDIVLVRIYDIAGARVVITWSDGKSEMVNFESGQSEKAMLAAGQGYHQLLSRVYQQGYTLQSTFASAGNAVTTLLFVKPAKP